MIMWSVMECCAAVVLDLVIMLADADLRTSEIFSLSCACCK